VRITFRVGLANKYNKFRGQNWPRASRVKVDFGAENELSI
jgi:hypothetical protein